MNIKIKFILSNSYVYLNSKQKIWHKQWEIGTKDKLRFIRANSNFVCNLRIQKYHLRDSDKNVAHYFIN